MITCDDKFRGNRCIREMGHALYHMGVGLFWTTNMFRDFHNKTDDGWTSRFTGQLPLKGTKHFRKVVMTILALDAMSKAEMVEFDEACSVDYYEALDRRDHHGMALAQALGNLTRVLRCVQYEDDEAAFAKESSS